MVLIKGENMKSNMPHSPVAGHKKATGGPAKAGPTKTRRLADDHPGTRCKTVPPIQSCKESVKDE